MAPKRKASSSMAASRRSKRVARAHTQQTNATAASNPTSPTEEHTAEQQQPTNFLDLPPEVRNNVYAHIMADEPQALLIPRNRGKVFSKSALSRVNHQVREEFTTLLHLAATDIVAEVTNFDFSHIVTFFNRLDKIDLKMLPTNSGQNERKMVITLDLTAVHDLTTLEKLERWLNRLNHPTKQGANVAVTYEASHASIGYHERIGFHAGPVFRSLRAPIDTHAFSLDTWAAEGSTRKSAAARKIVALIRRKNRAAWRDRIVLESRNC